MRGKIKNNVLLHFLDDILFHTAVRGSGIEGRDGERERERVRERVCVRERLLFVFDINLKTNILTRAAHTMK